MNELMVVVIIMVLVIIMVISHIVLVYVSIKKKVPLAIFICMLTILDVLLVLMNGFVMTLL